VERAQNAAEASDVILLVLDATEGVTAEDRTVARQVMEEVSRVGGRGSGMRKRLQIANPMC